MDFISSSSAVLNFSRVSIHLLCMKLMKKYFLILLLLSGAIVHAQETHLSKDKLFNGQVKFYPLSALTAFKSEFGIGLPNKWQINGLGMFYYQQFYMFRKAKSLLPTLYYQPTDGYGAFLSLEKTLNNPSFSLGARIGTKQFSSNTFDVTGEFRDIEIDGKELAKISNENYYFLFVSRMSSAHKGLILELIGQGGLAYIMRREQTENIYTGMQSDLSDSRYTYVSPHISIGLNIGFGW